MPVGKGSSGASKATDGNTAAAHEMHAAEKESNPADTADTSTPSSAASVQTPASTMPSVQETASPGSLTVAVAPQQTQTVTPAVSQPASDSRRDGTATSPDASTGVAVGASEDAQALAPINTARVIQSMQGSEMRVGMHSAEFGNVSVSALLNRQSIAAQISFEHMDLGKALTAHLPSMEARLSSDYGMHAKVEVRDQSMAAAGEGGRGESRRGDGYNGTGTGPSVPASTYVESSRVVDSKQARSAGESTRLDVQA